MGRTQKGEGVQPGSTQIKVLKNTLFREHRDSSVGIETRYGMEGPEIEARRGQDFPQPSRPTHPPI